MPTKAPPKPLTHGEKGELIRRLLVEDPTLTTGQMRRLMKSRHKISVSPAYCDHVRAQWRKTQAGTWTVSARFGNETTENGHADVPGTAPAKSQTPVVANSALTYDIVQFLHSVREIGGVAEAKKLLELVESL